MPSPLSRLTIHLRDIVSPLVDLIESPPLRHPVQMTLLVAFIVLVSVLRGSGAVYSVALGSCVGICVAHCTHFIATQQHRPVHGRYSAAGLFAIASIVALASLTESAAGHAAGTLFAYGIAKTVVILTPTPAT